MEVLERLMNSINDIVWSTPLVVLCLGAGIFLSFRLRFPQFRHLGSMVRLTVSNETSDSGITPFQAFSTSVGSRVGMGNIAGVATAIFMGGPGITMPGLHTNSIASAFGHAFGIADTISAAALTIVLGLVVCGGAKRIGKVAELITPFMCVAYVVLSFIVIVYRIEDLPGVFGTIFSSAFGMHEAFSGIVGSMIAWGVKRGVYSNEAGQGSGAIVSAVAETSHPAKQGLVQIFSIARMPAPVSRSPWVRPPAR